jgi:hypothetical protein
MVDAGREGHTGLVRSPNGAGLRRAIAIRARSIGKFIREHNRIVNDFLETSPCKFAYLYQLTAPATSLRSRQPLPPKCVAMGSRGWGRVYDQCKCAVLGAIHMG